MSNTLKKITTRAKQIYAKGGTWRGAIKKAGAEYRGSGLKTKRRHSTTKKHRRKKVGVVWPAAVAGYHKKNEHPDTISHHVNMAKKIIADKIAAKEVQKFTTKLKRNKRKIQKEISALKKQYRKL